jgi:hypothetical protein
LYFTCPIRHFPLFCALISDSTSTGYLYCCSSYTHHHPAWHALPALRAVRRASLFATSTRPTHCPNLRAPLSLTSPTGSSTSRAPVGMVRTLIYCFFFFLFSSLPQISSYAVSSPSVHLTRIRFRLPQHSRQRSDAPVMRRFERPSTELPRQHWGTTPSRARPR